MNNGTQYFLLHVLRGELLLEKQRFQMEYAH